MRIDFNPDRWDVSPQVDAWVVWIGRPAQARCAMYLTSKTEPRTGAFIGLTLVVENERRPGLCFESGQGRRLRLCTPAATLMWARREEAWAGVWLLRAEPREPTAIVPPITTRDVRGCARIEDWMSWFARALEQSAASPLGPGRWQMVELGPSSRSPRSERHADTYRGTTSHFEHEARVWGLRDALALPRLHHERWGVSGSGKVAPLRAPSSPEASRVKVWRKHARAGSLPPIFLWRVAPLDMALVLDGHDRLLAAAAEGVQPRVIVLWQVFEEAIDGSEAWRAEAVRRYELAFDDEARLSAGARARLNQSLELAFCPWERVVTSARFRQSLAAEWDEEVRVQLAAEPEAHAAMCGP